MSRGSTTIFFDGGCQPNPGPVEVAVVCGGKGHFRDDLGEGDNSAAEWLALLFAIDRAKTLGVSDVLLVGDSKTVIEQARGAQRCRSAHLQPYADAFRTAIAGMQRVRLKHVPRGKNLAGLALAHRALQRQPSGQLDKAIVTSTCDSPT